MSPLFFLHGVLTILWFWVLTTHITMIRAYYGLWLVCYFLLVEVFACYTLLQKNSRPLFGRLWNAYLLSGFLGAAGLIIASVTLPFATKYWLGVLLPLAIAAAAVPFALTALGGWITRKLIGPVTHSSQSQLLLVIISGALGLLLQKSKFGLDNDIPPMKWASVPKTEAPIDVSCVSADGRILATAASDGRGTVIKIWMVAEGKEKLRTSQSQEHSAEMCHFRPDNTLDIIYRDGLVERRNAGTLALIKMNAVSDLRALPHRILFESDDELFWFDGTNAIDPWTGASLAKIITQVGNRVLAITLHKQIFYSLLYSPNKAMEIFANNLKSKASSNVSLNTLYEFEGFSEKNKRPKNYSWREASLAISPDGQSIAFGMPKGGATHIDLRTKEQHPLFAETYSSEAAPALSFSPDGSYLIATQANHFSVWKTKPLKIAPELKSKFGMDTSKNYLWLPSKTPTFVITGTNNVFVVKYPWTVWNTSFESSTALGYSEPPHRVSLFPFSFF